jgi:hypothetical protein
MSFAPLVLMNNLDPAVTMSNTHPKEVVLSHQKMFLKKKVVVREWPVVMTKNTIYFSSEVDLT